MFPGINHRNNEKTVWQFVLFHHRFYQEKNYEDSASRFYAGNALYDKGKERKNQTKDKAA